MKESTTYQYFFRNAREEGREEGRQAGVLEGRLEGEAKGEARGEAKGEARGEFKGKIGTLLNILNTRFGEVPPQLHARFQAITDLATLDAAILNAISIKSLDELV